MRVIFVIVLRVVGLLSVSCVMDDKMNVSVLLSGLL